LYFPTAFTPNSDGKNDAFKPTVFGALQKYHLTIFNRLGQKVFETAESQKGWDGTINGAPQNTQTFIWLSPYLFNGPPGKGTGTKRHFTTAQVKRK
jgi:gliding motility-associated-like protein